MMNYCFEFYLDTCLQDTQPSFWRFSSILPPSFVQWGYNENTFLGLWRWILPNLGLFYLMPRNLSRRSVLVAACTGLKGKLLSSKIWLTTYIFLMKSHLLWVLRRWLPAIKCLLCVSTTWILSTRVNAELSACLEPQFWKAETGGPLELIGQTD